MVDLKDLTEQYKDEEVNWLRPDTIRPDTSAIGVIMPEHYVQEYDDLNGSVSRRLVVSVSVGEKTYHYKVPKPVFHRLRGSFGMDTADWIGKKVFLTVDGEGKYEHIKASVIPDE